MQENQEECGVLLAGWESTSGVRPSASKGREVAPGFSNTEVRLSKNSLDGTVEAKVWQIEGAQRRMGRKEPDTQNQL